MPTRIFSSSSFFFITLCGIRKTISRFELKNILSFLEPFSFSRKWAFLQAVCVSDVMSP